MSYHYARTSRATHALTESELLHLAPSIGAVDKHESRSAKFVAVPTIDVVREMSRHGFRAVGAKQSRTRDESRREFTKHLIRFRHESTIVPERATMGVPEIILRNANDGTAAYELFAGVWREICLNGLVVCESQIESVKVRHNGRAVLDDVIEGTYRVLGQTESFMRAPDEWSQVRLSRDHALAYAQAAHMLRFDDKPTPITREQLLIPRRSEDHSPDLWTVFNVVQENAIKGGLSGFRQIEGSRGSTVRRVTMREVKGIDQDVKLNRALWSLTENMARIMGTNANAVPVAA